MTSGTNLKHSSLWLYGLLSLWLFSHMVAAQPSFAIAKTPGPRSVGAVSQPSRQARAPQRVRLAPSADTTALEASSVQQILDEQWLHDPWTAGSAVNPAAASLSLITQLMDANQNNALFGNTVTGLGDINGDGYTDLAVGASAFEYDKTDEGAAFLYFGQGGGSFTHTFWRGNQNGANFGRSIAKLGDINNDGYGDLIIGADRYDDGETDEGAAFVYLGSADGNLVWSAGMEGNQGNAQFGSAVASAGDIDSNGYGDIVVSAPGYSNGESNEGAVFVYRSLGSGNVASPWVWESNQGGAGADLSFASGDFNGDGRSDIAIGAPHYGNGESNEGAVFIFLSTGDGNFRWAAQLELNQTDAKFGHSLAGLGDVNHDGYSDLVIGADGFNQSQGAALVYLGAADGTPTLAARLTSNQANSGFGARVAAVGDVDGDSNNDLVVGALWYTNGQSKEGGAFVYLGQGNGQFTLADTLESNQADAWLGNSVGAAGDVNGDNLDDVIVGAPRFNGQGAAFVYLGAGNQPTLKPDFVISDITLSSATPGVGGTLTASVTVTNQGGASGDAGNLSIWSNQSSAVSCGASAADGVLSVGELAVNDARTLTFDLPAGTTAGSRVLRAFVDSGCITDESDEGNNQATQSYSVVGQPDFVISSITLTPSAPEIGKTFTATVVVKNQGIAAGNGGNLNVWLDQAGSVSCGDSGDRTVSVGTLGPGASIKLSVGGLLADSVGSKTLRAMVESDCVTDESDESNNQSAFSYSVTGKPDFVITDLSFEPSSPHVGEHLTVSVTVQNQGTVAGDAGQLSVWSHQSSTPSCGVAGDQGLNIGTLAVDETQTFTFDVAVGSTVGSKRLLAFADSNCATVELNETNNQASKSYTVVGQPDFVVRIDSLTPSVPQAGSSFTATVTVKNQGSAAGKAGLLSVWADQAGAVDCGSSGDKTVSVGSLAVGASTTLTVSGLPASNAGSRTLRAMVDSNCETDETDEENNQATQSYSVTAATRPDFVIGAISLTPSSPTAGKSFTASITVQNQGKAAGNAGRLTVWADQANAQGCAASGDQSIDVGNLASGASTTLTLNLTAGKAGAKTLRTAIDSQCATTESDELNNQSTLAYTVSNAGRADFVVTAVSLNTNTPTAGSTFSATVTVQNQGSAAGNAGQLNVWSNQAAAQDCGAESNQSVAVGTLAAGASTTLTVSDLAAGAAGAKTLRAFVDGDCETSESDETNNQSTLAYTVKSSKRPDFVVTSVSLNPTVPTVNGKFTATITVQNQGSTSGNAGRLNVWANQAATQTCDADGDRSIAIGALAVGASSTLNVSNLSAGAAGTKTLRVFVDGNCETDESDESNNQTTESYTVKAGKKPDLVVTNLSLTPSTPTTGSTFSATVTVSNQGTAAGKGGSLSVWLDQPTAQTCKASGDRTQTVGALAVGASQTLTFDNLSATSTGNKTLRAFIDSACAIAEANEDNNQSRLAYKVAEASLSDWSEVKRSLNLPAPTGGSETAYGQTLAAGGDWLWIGAPKATTEGDAERGLAYLREHNDSLDTWVSSATNPPLSEGKEGDGFSGRVVVNGDWAAVAALGVDRGANDDVGQVYLYQRQKGVWELAQTVRAEDSALFDQAAFGQGLALSTTWLAIGAPNANKGDGAVYLYKLQNSRWTLQQTLNAPKANQDGHFGTAVALDESKLVIGEPDIDLDNTGGSGQLYGYRLVNAKWTALAAAKFKQPSLALYRNGRLGAALSLQGNTLVAAAPDATVLDINRDSHPKAGRVFLYAWNSSAQGFSLSTTRLELDDEELTTQAQFGAALALAEQGKTLLVGAPGADTTKLKDCGRALIYQLQDGGWLPMQNLPGQKTKQGLGRAVALLPNAAFVGTDAALVRVFQPKEAGTTP